MMSLNEPDRQALGCIEDGLACSDPRLAYMLSIFSRLVQARRCLQARRSGCTPSHDSPQPAGSSSPPIIGRRWPASSSFALARAPKGATTAGAPA